ncbi:LLM class flavin-dependent oxidoreductase [Pseudonocardia ailaonensis]|uniref:LLM class flavin-dependent oxidoreductase n=1 Tax=Pseudonocardia ailaonensis TaxID=367279 RepID=A0ABN2MKG7_9PSEU
MTYPAHVTDGLLGHTKRVDQNPVFGDNRFKLGVFAPNVSGGMIMSHAETGFRVTWDQQLEIARAADRGGLDAVVPVGRWTGFGGDTNFNGVCFETYTWAAGLAQATENIAIFTTTHLPTVHPIVAAKMATTIDHISGGRFGMNLVMGWFTPEMEMFGRAQLEHDRRYEFGQEWLDFAMRLWNETEPFDVDGEFFTSHGAHGYPRPVQAPRPALLNAGSSPRGQRFAAQNVDINLIALPTEQVPDYVGRIKSTAQDDHQRDIDVWTYCLVICRETEKEARRVQQDIIDRGDWAGAKNVMDVLGVQSPSFATQITEMQERFIAGWGGPNVVGTPEQVAEQLAEYEEAGLTGAVFGFLDYARETPEFCDEVLPILQKNGLRA